MRSRPGAGLRAAISQRGTLRRGANVNTRCVPVLRSRLVEAKIEEENAKYAANRKQQVGTGERNEKIRTYNFPQNRVTDHRIGLTLYNLDRVIQGDLAPLTTALIDHDRREQLGEVVTS